MFGVGIRRSLVSLVLREWGYTVLEAADGEDAARQFAFGEDGVILTSREGMVWRSASSKSKSRLNGAAYSGKDFVAVGNAGTILTSSDGSEWTERKSGTTTTNLWGAAYGAGRFVVVGNDGKILTSPDGAEWTERKSATSANLIGVAYGDSGFVAVGNGGKIVTSSDGLEWSERDSGIRDLAKGLKGVVYGKKGYAAVGDAGTIVTSADGVNWKAASSGTENDLWSITYCLDQYITTGMLDTPEMSRKSHRRVYLSSDGEKWSPMIMRDKLALFGVACGRDRTLFVVGKKILQSDALPEAK